MGNIPVYSSAIVTVKPPDTWYKTRTKGGYCIDRNLEDNRFLSKEYDFSRPPSNSDMFWTGPDLAYTSSSVGWRVIKGFRGATLIPKYSYIPMSQVQPCSDSLFTPSDVYPTTRWQAYYHESLKMRAAYWLPTSYATSLGFLRTINLAEGQGFVVLYRALTPFNDDNNPEVDEARWHGFNLVLGLDDTGFGQYGLNLPHSKIDTAPYTYNWRLFKLNDAGDGYVLKDMIATPSGGSFEKIQEAEAEWIQVENINGQIVITKNGMENAWVYGEDEKFNIRSGRVGLQVYGCAGYFVFEKITYVASAQIEGKLTYLPSWINGDGSTNVVWSSYDAADASVVGLFNNVTTPGDEYSTGWLQVTVTNNSAGLVRTPVIYNVQEIHEPIWGAPAGINEYQIETECQNISINYQETGRGATATIELNNFRRDTQNGGYELDFWTDSLIGVSKVTIEAKHAADVASTTLFTGYITQTQLDTSGMWPKMVLECQDESFFLSDGINSMIFLPDLAGWDLKEAVELCLDHWRHDITATGLVFNNYPDDGIFVPIFETGGSEALKFEPETSLDEVFDKICSITGWRWWIDEQGIIQFDWAENYPTATFDLNDTTYNEDDRLMLAESVKNFKDARNVCWGRGPDSLGNTKEVLFINNNTMIDTNNDYLGVELWSPKIEKDNPNVSSVTNRRLFEKSRLTREIDWETYGKNLMPGDKVSVNVSNIGIPAATNFTILSKDISISRDGSGPFIWRDKYHGAIVGFPSGVVA